MASNKTFLFQFIVRAHEDLPSLNKSLINVIFFTDRKRMSVVVQDEDGQIWLYCKGADSSVRPLTVAGPIDDTFQHVTNFASVRLI
jgi:magnesium-transporting ATPase (P-type)